VKKVKISTMCACGMRGEANFMLTADSNAKAKNALLPLVAEIRAHDVLVVDMPNKPIELQEVAKKIAVQESKLLICIKRQSDADGRPVSLQPRIMQKK